MSDIADLVQTVNTAADEKKLSVTAAKNIAKWLGEPQYAKYVPRLTELINGGQFQDLDTMFWEEIPFGTGGRRGLMAELGSATVNERTIAESANGLATYFKQQNPSVEGKGVVACDSRNRSPEFARLTATTLAAHGLHVYYFESNRSTPELSFAVRHLGCHVGVMISASHNPPSDNGFKAYWSSGAQVLHPEDKGIIDCVNASGEIPTLDFDTAVSDGKITVIGEDVDRAYVDAVKSLSLSEARDLSAIFTPLHGVGETSVYRVLREAGFSGVEVFEPQRSADGNFPNVPDQLPNPERPEVFQPAVEHASQTGAALILASDPDADRLGVSVKNSAGEFVHLTGNRIGVLVVDYILRKRAAAGDLSGEHYVVETLVTTPLIAAIARSHGVQVIDDLLVGFKYIAQTMDREGPDRFVFGAEESLGYLAGKYCRDKDAAIAALYISELASELAAEGKTLVDRLDELYVQFGYYLEDQLSEKCEGSRGKEQIDALMTTFRADPPKQLAGIELDRVRDYGKHEIRNLPDNDRESELPAPDGNLLFFDSVDDGVSRVSIAVRPSGTEPKIKFYFFAQSQVPGADQLSDIKQETAGRMNALKQELSQWVRNVLAES